MLPMGRGRAVEAGEEQGSDHGDLLSLKHYHLYRVFGFQISRVFWNLSLCAGFQAVAVSMGQTVVLRITSIENFEVTLRHGRRRVSCR
jgi:hypothetical protein